MRGQTAIGLVLFFVGMVAGLAVSLYFMYLYQPAGSQSQGAGETRTVTVTETETVTVSPGPRLRAFSLYRSTDEVRLDEKVNNLALSFNGMESAHRVVVSLNVEVSRGNGTDGSAALLVLLNGELPMYGDFGVTQAVRDYLSRPGVEYIMVPLVTRSLVLVPRELGGAGNSGVRSLVFNGTLLKPGRNSLALILLDDDGDAVVVRGINVTVYVPES